MSDDSIVDIQLPSLNPEVWIQLLAEPEQFEQVAARVEHVIWMSFSYLDVRVHGRQPIITEGKIQERFKICQKWFCVMRSDCGYSLERTLDMLPRALANELLGLPFDPPSARDGKARGWTTEEMDEIAQKLP